MATSTALLLQTGRASDGYWITIVIILVALLVVLLIARELTCWYLKLTSIEKLLREMTHELRSLNDKVPRPEPPVARIPSNPPDRSRSG